MARTSDEIEKLIDEWESLRADYASRGSTGIVDFINAELRKLRAERDTAEIVRPAPDSPA
ncbi:MAG: hypothetical protein Q7J32_02270 [Sphingomonadaceae bacterium]|nr:hypothetical protein [Sphingomonadaceae bacterium]